MRALIVTGSGRYADPWHPLAETSAAIADILTADGWQVTVNADVDRALADLAPSSTTAGHDLDLLVVNAADPWRNGETGFGAPEGSLSGLDAALKRGVGVLAMHTAVSSLRDYSNWAAAIGAIWLPEVSMHPPLGEARVQIVEHPLTSGLQDFSLHDERYSRLQAVGERTILARHTLDGVRHPLAWIREHEASRVACDMLGHDTRSYESAEHRELIRRLARWAGCH
ncbi:MAG: ThuA domain-containing protein [Terrimesophilobacter sp.]